MARSSYEMSSASVFLCCEDSSSVFGEDEEAGGGKVSSGWDVAVKDCFPSPSEECVARLVRTEAEHMPREDYGERLRRGADLRVRVDAIDWIWKVHTHYRFGPVTVCLAVNYLDRFLSLYQLPEGKAWMTQLLSVACLSLAAKMEQTSVPPPLELQEPGDARYVFEPRTIQRMELLMLSTLEWRMQAVTPFSFIDYFLRELTGGGAGNAPPSRRALQRSAELILSIARGGNCLDFKPSEIAASVAAAVVGEEDHTVVRSRILTHVDKERVLRCCEAIQAMSPPKTAASADHSSAPPRSPNGVLDAGCSLSYRSSDGTTSSAAVAATIDSSPASNKRRKLT